MEIFLEKKLVSYHSQVPNNIKIFRWCFVLLWMNCFWLLSHQDGRINYDEFVAMMRKGNQELTTTRRQKWSWVPLYIVCLILCASLAVSLFNLSWATWRERDWMFWLPHDSIQMAALKQEKWAFLCPDILKISTILTLLLSVWLLVINWVYL